MVTSPFKAAYKQLNLAQREAVDSIEGPVMVVAGPGTGKTQILTVRIANILLQTQVNPENILALTFTESAAAAMRQRLVGMIGTPGYRVEISTFHGFCNNVIKNNPEEFPESLNSDSITEVEQIQVLEGLILSSNLKLLKPFGEPLYHLRNVLSAINDLKKEGVGPEQFEKAIKQQRDEFLNTEDMYHEKGRYQGQMKGKYQELQKLIDKNEELLLLYIKYQKKLSETRCYDFNDMLLYVRDALGKNKSLLLRLQERYQYLLVDEHQDTNSAQNKIIENLSSFFEEPNLFVVGDEKQAIFRFQGASLENFLYFKTLFPAAKLVNLDRNYRSHQWILDASSSLIEKNITTNALFPSRVKLLAQSEVEVEPIKVATFSDYHAEYEYIAQEIKKEMNRKLKLSEIAILARRNRDLQEMATSLQRHGIPYTVSSDMSVLADLDIQKFILILRAVHGLGNQIDLIKAMHIDFLGIEPLDTYKLLKKASESQTTIYDLASLLLPELENPQRIVDFLNQLKKWNIASYNDGLEHLFVMVFKNSGFREYVLSSPSRFEIIDKLTVLFEITKEKIYKNPNYSLTDFITYLDLLEKHQVGIEARSITKYQDCVSLMTAHKSKGLEFDSVYLINSIDGVWGNNRARSSSFVIPWDILGVKLIETDGNEDERRLFYVSLTRAKKHITISYSTRSLEGKERLPSQFLEEIDPQFLENVSTERFEKEFLDHKEIIFDIQTEAEIPKKNKQFIAELFKGQGLNVSGLNNYLECPWKYFFVSLLRLPDTQDKHLIFGTAMHKTIDYYIKNYSNKKANVMYLLKLFSEIVARSSIAQREKEEIVKKGEEILPKLCQEVLENLPPNIQSEVSIKGVKLADDVFLSGRLDLVEFLDKKGMVRIHDFKTGKHRSRNQIMGQTVNADGNYYRQLIFYKLLLDRYHGKKMQMSEGVIDFVEPDERGRFKSESFEIAPEEVASLEKLILFIANEIKSLAFWNRTCKEKDCEYCKLRELMGNNASVV